MTGLGLGLIGSKVPSSCLWQLTDYVTDNTDCNIAMFDTELDKELDMSRTSFDVISPNLCLELYIELDKMGYIIGTCDLKSFIFH